MEAAHVGAYFVNADDSEFTAALNALAHSSQLTIPRSTPGRTLLNPDGSLSVDGDPDYVSKLHLWFKDAEFVRMNCTQPPGESLAVSTWEYGDEPVMPFATAYAAYFQNSIREASLVRESRAGIIYGRGGGGTLREIFQDVEENYYVSSTDDFTPMIFCDPQNYWCPDSSDAKKIKIDDVLVRIFSKAHPIPSEPQPPRVNWPPKVVYSTDVAKILSTLDAHKWASAVKVEKIFASLVV